MAINAFHLMIFVGAYCTLSVRVRHKIEKSELLDVVERSWNQNGVPVEYGGKSHEVPN